MRERHGDAAAKNKIENAEKKRCRQRQHGLGDKAEPVASHPRIVQRIAGAGIDQITEAADRFQQIRLQALVLGAKQHLLGFRLLAIAIGGDCRNLEPVQRLGILLELFERGRFCRRCPARLQRLDRRLAAVLLVFPAVKRNQMTLIAAHHIQARFVTSLLGAKGKVLRQGLEGKVLLDRQPLLVGAIGRQNECAPESTVRTTVTP